MPTSLIHILEQYSQFLFFPFWMTVACAMVELELNNVYFDASHGSVDYDVRILA